MESLGGNMELKCDICGGALEMDASLEFAQCELCRMKYPKESLQAKVQKSGVKANNSVSIQGTETKSSLLKNAETYMNLKRYEHAMDVFKKVVEKYPDKAEGWWGVFRCAALSCIWDELVEGDEYAQTAMRLHDYSQEYKRIWKELELKYTKGFDYDQKASSPFESLRQNDIELLLREFEHPRLQKLQKIALSTYCREFEAGKTTFFELHSSEYVHGKMNLFEAFNQTKDVRGKHLHNMVHLEGGNKVSISSCLELEEFLYKGIQYYENVDYKLSREWIKPYVTYIWEFCEERFLNDDTEIGKRSIEQVKPMSENIRMPHIFQLGSTIVLGRTKGEIVENRYKDYGKMRWVSGYIIILNQKNSLDEMQTQISNIWKSMGRCTSCGGKIIGGFFKEKKCERCRKKY